MTNKTLAGLEAIKFMEQGGMIIEKNAEDPCILKIEEGLIWIKSPAIEGYWMVEPCFDFSVAYEEYVEPKSLTGWERVINKHDTYFCIGHCGDIRPYSDDFLGYDRTIYKTGNYFSTKEKAEEINFKQTLFRKLQRFSDENGGNEIDWNDRQTPKFNICYDYGKEEITTEWFYDEYYFGSVYFISEEIAQQAIELFHDDLIEYFTM